MATIVPHRDLAWSIEADIFDPFRAPDPTDETDWIAWSSGNGCETTVDLSLLSARGLSINGQVYGGVNLETACGSAVEIDPDYSLDASAPLTYVNESGGPLVYVMQLTSTEAICVDYGAAIARTCSGECDGDACLCVENPNTSCNQSRGVTGLATSGTVSVSTEMSESQVWYELIDACPGTLDVDITGSVTPTLFPLGSGVDACAGLIEGDGIGFNSRLNLGLEDRPYALRLQNPGGACEPIDIDFTIDCEDTSDPPPCEADESGDCFCPLVDLYPDSCESAAELPIPEGNPGHGELTGSFWEVRDQDWFHFVDQGMCLLQIAVAQDSALGLPVTANLYDTTFFSGGFRDCEDSPPTVALQTATVGSEPIEIFNANSSQRFYSLELSTTADVCVDWRMLVDFGCSNTCRDISHSSEDVRALYDEALAAIEGTRNITGLNEDGQLVCMPPDTRQFWWQLPLCAGGEWEIDLEGEEGFFNSDDVSLDFFENEADSGTSSPLVGGVFSSETDVPGLAARVLVSSDDPHAFAITGDYRQNGVSVNGAHLADESGSATAPLHPFLPIQIEFPAPETASHCPTDLDVTITVDDGGAEYGLDAFFSTTGLIPGSCQLESVDPECADRREQLDFTIFGANLDSPIEADSVFVSFIRTDVSTSTDPGAEVPACTPPVTFTASFVCPEACDTAIDEDGNSLTDCLDTLACGGDATCTCGGESPVHVRPEISGSTLMAGSSDPIRGFRGDTRQIVICGGGLDFVGEGDPRIAGSLRFDGSTAEIVDGGATLSVTRPEGLYTLDIFEGSSCRDFNVTVTTTDGAPDIANPQAVGTAAGASINRNWYQPHHLQLDSIGGAFDGCFMRATVSRIFCRPCLLASASRPISSSSRGGSCSPSSSRSA